MTHFLSTICVCESYLLSSLSSILIYLVKADTPYQLLDHSASIRKIGKCKEQRSAYDCQNIDYDKIREVLAEAL